MKTNKVSLSKYPSRDQSKNYWRLSFSPMIYHPTNGKSIRFKSLGIYTYVKPKNSAQKLANQRTQELLENIRTDVFIKLRNKDVSFLNERQERHDFIDYFKEVANRRKGGKDNTSKWEIVLMYLQDFKPSIAFEHIDKSFADAFKNYLLNRPHRRLPFQTIKPSSAASYFSKFIFVLKEAYKEGFLKTNLARQIDRIKCEEAKKEFFTQDQLRALYNTDCIDEDVKRGCLFMAFTGLRISDLIRLRWENIEYRSTGEPYIKFQHKKTRIHQILPLSNAAMEVVGPIQKEGLVFKNIAKKYSVLKQWVRDARINKNVGFHAFRRTFATILSNSKVEVYTIKELLGHKSLNTTLGYTRMLDETKFKAVEKLNMN